jgi:hypothetical protein
MNWSIALVAASLALVGCTQPSASLECEPAWLESPDVGEACELELAEEALMSGTATPASTAREVISPRDPASGLATGKRSHKPLWIMP